MSEIDILNPNLALVERLFWLIKLRWIAILGVAFTTTVTYWVFGIPIGIVPLYWISLWLAVYNFIFLSYLSQRDKERLVDNPVLINRLANLQISLDLLSLVGLIHYSGGVENPFIFYFIFHMIIASILLSRRASFLQATLSVLLFISMITLEFLGFLPHYCLKGFITHTQHYNLIYIAGVGFVFISTIYIAVYMATSISVRLREREKKLKEANVQLLDKDRIKSEYVLRVSHDIKEHLSAIQSCIKPVTAGITGPLGNKQFDLLNRADQRAGKLMSFVKSLLELSRIKLNRDIKTEHVSLPMVVKNALAYSEAKARQKGITLCLHIDSSIDKILGVQTYLEEAISNLVANAVKYTPSNGKIDVLVFDKGDSILIQIKDTGIGIPPNEMPKIFDEFYRASNAKKVVRNGTGLGLSIAKQIVERHGGRIWVESEVDKGSIFNIILPKSGGGIYV